MSRRGSLVRRAIAAEAWELVALALVLGALETLRTVPPDALDALLDAAGGPNAH